MGLVLGLTRPTLCWSAHDDDARLKESWKEPRRGDDENSYVSLVKETMFSAPIANVIATQVDPKHESV